MYRMLQANLDADSLPRPMGPIAQEFIGGYLLCIVT